MKQVWADLEIFTGQSPLWSSPSIDACLNDFLIKPSLHCWKALPLLVARGLWLAHNDCLFGNQSRPTYKVSQQVTAISQAYKVSTFIKTPWQISPLNINQTNPWGFLTGLAKGLKRYVAWASSYSSLCHISLQGKQILEKAPTIWLNSQLFWHF